MNTLQSLSLKKRKKGFTLTELAIVIAVIAILIAVLVPTFSSVITKAKVSNESVACKNEWTNFYIDADIAANGTDDNYLVVYTDNSYTDSSKETYYHGYLAEEGVYDTETQYNVYVSTSNIATYDGDSNSYNYVGSYEYMASQVSIYSTGSTAYIEEKTSFTYKKTEGNTETTVSVTVDNSGLTITGNNNTYTVTGTMAKSDTNLSGWWSASTAPDYAFSMKTYYDVSQTNITKLVIATYYANDTDGTDRTKTFCDATKDNTETTTAFYAAKNGAFDGDSYSEWILDGKASKYVITYYTSATSGSYTLAGTITINLNVSFAS